MSDITFYCTWCRGRLVVEDRGAETKVPCPLCGKNIVIPPKPVWLPTINEALRKIVQEEVAGKIGTATARAKLRDTIIAAGYHPERAHVEPDSPEDLLSYERLNFVLNTNRDIAYGFRQLVMNNQQGVVDEWPAWEFKRHRERVIPRCDPSYQGDAEIGWGDRWEQACAAAGDENALRVYKQTGRMIALVDSDVWDHIYGDWDDSVPDNLFGAPAFGSGYGMDIVGRPEAEALRLLGSDDKIKPRKIVPPRLIPIEDERITEYLWNKPIPCDHCGEDKPTRLIYVCDACDGSICPDCAAKGCSGPEPPPEPRDAIQCCSRAISEMMGRELPLEREVVERVLQFCDRAFEFGFAAHHRDIEARAHRTRGEAFESLGQKERALHEYELAVEKDPEVGVKKRIASLRKECA